MNPFRPFKKYVSLRKICREQQVQWQNTTVPVGAAIANYPHSAGMVRWFSTGAAIAGEQLGIMKCTWYVTLRG